MVAVGGVVLLVSGGVSATNSLVIVTCYSLLLYVHTLDSDTHHVHCEWYITVIYFVLICLNNTVQYAPVRLLIATAHIHNTDTP